MSPSDPAFAPLLERLMADLHEHVEHEKNEDMPRLEGLLPRAESEMWARKFQQTKKYVGTRPHLSEPREAPFQAFAALLAAPIDRLRDLMKTWPDQEEVAKITRNQNTKL